MIGSKVQIPWPGYSALNSVYLQRALNLSDLTNAGTARTNLGLVAGGAGDIWVEKAGDTMTGQLIFDGVATDITTVTNQNLTFKPHGSGILQLQAGSGGVSITTDAGNSDISILPHGTGSVFLNDTLEVEADGSGPGAQSLSILKFSNGDRIYSQTVVDRMFYTSDRFEVLSKDGAETIAAFNGSASANADRVIFYKGICSGSYAATAPPANGMILSGDVGIGTNSPANRFHVVGASNTFFYFQGNSNFGSMLLRAGATTRGFFGYSNTGGYINNSINQGIHLRGENGISFGKAATKAFDVTGDAYVWIGAGAAAATAKLHIEAGTTTLAPFKLTSGSVLTTPAAGAFEFDGMGVYFTPNDERRSIQLADGSVTSTTTVANTTTETTIYSEPISAGSLDVGEVIDILLNGFYSTANAADTFTLRFKIGATTVLSVTSTAKNVTNTPFEIDFRTTIRTIGAGGTCISYASVKLDNADASAAATTTTAINTTNANTLTVTLQWSNALAANTLSLTQGVTHFAYNA